jgi:hypothetical protein
MSQDEPSGPDLVGVIADANSAGLECCDWRIQRDGYDIAGPEHLRVNSRTASSTSFAAVLLPWTSTPFPIRPTRVIGRARSSGLLRCRGSTAGKRNSSDSIPRTALATRLDLTGSHHAVHVFAIELEAALQLRKRLGVRQEVERRCELHIERQLLLEIPNPAQHLVRVGLEADVDVNCRVAPAFEHRGRAAREVHPIRVATGTTRPSSRARRRIRSASAALRKLSSSGEAGDTGEDRVVAGVCRFTNLLAQLSVQPMRGGRLAFGARCVEPRQHDLGTGQVPQVLIGHRA